MTKEALAYINTCMVELEVPYEFLTWGSDLRFPFFVGEYREETPMNEDGLEQGTFMLTGTATGNFLQLEEIKQKIHDYFGNEGRTAILDSGSGIAISYDSSFPIPSEDQDIFRIQVNLHVQEWRC